ncbi:MAG: hypothetical protein WBC83_00310 [Minisyncoccia bacterium]
MKKIILTSISVILFAISSPVYGAKGFLVEESGSSKVLITDGTSEYIIEHDYNCYDADFIEGSTIYIDTYYSPSYGDTIITSGFSGNTCKITSSDDVNIKKYYVDKLIDSEDKIIVSDKNGTQFLVEYGIGCGISMWRYEGKTVDIDVGGSFLDGIGDRMYLFNSERDCKIWDADELSTGGGYSSATAYAPIVVPKLSCPANSTLNTSDSRCYCNSGYIIDGNMCTISTSGSPYQNIRDYKIYREVRTGYALNSNSTCSQLGFTGEDFAMCEAFSKDSNKDRWATIDKPDTTVTVRSLLEKQQKESAVTQTTTVQNIPVEKVAITPIKAKVVAQKPKELIFEKKTEIHAATTKDKDLATSTLSATTARITLQKTSTQKHWYQRLNPFSWFR